MPFGAPHSRAVSGGDRALVLVDGDNVGGKFQEQGVQVWFDDLVDIIPRVMPGQITVDKVCIFLNALGFQNQGYGGLRLRDVNRFCLHQYDRAKGEPGPRDTELLREAYLERERYDLIIFMSYDTDFAKFARDIRQGIWDEGDDPDPLLQTRVILLAESPPGDRWRQKLNLPPDTRWDNYARPWVSINTVLRQLRQEQRRGHGSHS